MKKTFKEKYLELKKENEYLIMMLKDKSSDYLSLELQFFNFKSNLKKKEEIAEKRSFIIFIIGLSIISVFGLLGVIFGSLGLI